MGDFDKKKAFSIGGKLAGACAIIALLANVSEIVQLFKTDKPATETSTAVVEMVELEPVKKPETEPSEPVHLNSIKVSEHSKNFSDNNVSSKDIFGNTYYNSSTIGKSGLMKSEDYAIYYLGGKYKTLSGIIAVDEDNSKNAVGELSILCDDAEVYTTKQVERNTASIEFSIDIKGCQWLNICHDKSKMKFILADWKLEE
ncbi:MAG: NPCBM/NEW2 domain-containing protein [Ruminococcus sp.]|nr:NPCBM/NEW2 domain-containing protein [Ruminococcus sp.]